MKLLYSPMSPFARKVRVCAHELGIALPVAFVDPWTDEALRGANPLAKVPALVLADGAPLYDSRVICQYLDHLGGGGLYPAPGAALWRALRLEALADGICDAAVRRRMETIRQDVRHDDVIVRQALAMTAGLDALEAEAAAGLTGFGIGEIAAACAVGYLDLRFPDDRWRDGRPALAAWSETAAARPSMAATVVSPA